MTSTRRPLSRFHATAVYPLTPGTRYARKNIPKNTLQTVGLKMNKRQAWETIKGLARFLVSRDTHVELTGERGNNTIRITSRAEGLTS